MGTRLSRPRREKIADLAFLSFGIFVLFTGLCLVGVGIAFGSWLGGLGTMLAIAGALISVRGFVQAREIPAREPRESERPVRPAA